MKRADTFRGRIDMALPHSGISCGLFTYPAGNYAVESSEHWGIGIVRKPFKLAYCGFGSASCGQRDVRASEVIISEPGAGFDAKLTSEASIEYVLISAERFASVLPNHAKAMTRLETNRSMSLSSPLLSQLVHAVLDRLRQAPCSADHYVEALTDAIIADLVKDDGAPPKQIQHDPLALSDSDLAVIDAYIHDHLASRISIDELAQQTGVTMSTFRNAFKTKTGKTPYQYILDTRVDRARVMLRTSQEATAKIAFECGFSSQSHMTDVFRQRLGTTPNALRARV